MEQSKKNEGLDLTVNASAGEETRSADAPQTTGEIVDAPAAGEREDENARAEHFKRLMTGEYKDLFSAYFQETFNRRFREQKEMMAELDRARQVVAAAAARFGSDDIEALLAALASGGEGGDRGTAVAVSAAEDPQTVDSTVDGMAQNTAEAVRFAVEQARKETAEAVLGSIRARGLRPAENALSNGGRMGFGNGASRLSRADRADMARRAAEGERISF